MEKAVRNNEIVGRCLDMCPERERKTRELQERLHPLEVAPGVNPKSANASHKTMIKEYSRPAAGKADAVASDLRPPEVLLETMHYMITKLLQRSDQSFVTQYDFIFDRTRSIRQDLVIQRASGVECMQILELAIRFHLYSGYRLCTEHVSRFDGKINNDHTQECLKRLLVMYQDAETDGSTTSPNREEFEALYLIFNLGSPEALRHALSLPVGVRQCPSVQLALRIHSAHLQGNFIRVWRLGSQCGYIQSCALHRHLRLARWQALQILNTAYSSKNLRFPVRVLSKWLVFDSDNDTIEYLELCGLEVNDRGVPFHKSTPVAAETIPPHWKCSKLVDSKQGSFQSHDLIMGCEQPGQRSEGKYPSPNHPER
ncbi:SAC3 domain-containing protein 1-like [Asterias amurensis]|uniref:SAC3 domain-containing protein 1-like n=1 Tax=Asterias amurensis TaxID=7602 RepID=UPI003AB2A4A0